MAIAALALAGVAWAAPLASEEGGGGGANFFGLVPLIVFFPVAGLLLNLAFGKYLGEKWVGVVACGAAASSFVIAVLQLIGLVNNGYETQVVHLADWIVIGELVIPWAFQIDTLSATMMLVVTGVGTLIHIYAVGYEHSDVRHNGDPGRYARFFVYLNLFLAAMLILVGGNSYLTMFVGWEGVGLCSYLLIGFWFEKGEGGTGNARAGRKAFVANRIGDWAMLMAIFMLFWMFRSLTFDDIFGQLAGLRLSEQGQWMITAITLLLLIGATGKSAQVPLYVWLPDAMAGPTPVSALIHAATMVTAGIYMITRSHALYALAPISQTTVAIVGAVTALWAATIAVGQFDIKRVLAYSTISQLGFMIAAVGLGGYVAGMFHLVTHAFFKALLFLSSGSVIQAVERGHSATRSASGAHAGEKAHAVGGGGHGDEHADEHPMESAHADAHPVGHHGPDPQDMRNMGGLWSKLPVTKWVYLVGALALAGIVPFAGFWSKDEILLDAFRAGGEGAWYGWVVYGLLTVAAFFTAFYMGRQILMVFFGAPRTDAAKHATESPWVMTIPLIALAFLSLFGGALNLPTIAGFTPPGAHAFTEWLGHTLGGEAHAEASAASAAEAEAGAHGAESVAVEKSQAEGALDFTVAGISTGLALAAIGISYAIYRSKPTTAEERDPLHGMIGPVFTGMNRKWWVDEFYDLIILRPYNWLARISADVIDGRFWHDWFHDSVLAGLFNTFSRVLADGVDKGFVDPVISDFPADLSKGIAAFFRRVQTGLVRAYALAVFVGVVVILGYFLIVR
jgi:NADH-quinone oxidoreductase subunit L